MAQQQVRIVLELYVERGNIPPLKAFGFRFELHLNAATTDAFSWLGYLILLRAVLLLLLTTEAGNPHLRKSALLSCSTISK